MLINLLNTILNLNTLDVPHADRNICIRVQFPVKFVPKVACHTIYFKDFAWNYNGFCISADC